MRDLLSRLDELYRAVNFAAAALLGAPSWEDRIEEVLQRLGRATGASGVYVFESGRTADGDLVATLRYEWTGPDVQPQKDNPRLRNVGARADGLGDWVETIRGGQPIYGHVKDLEGCGPFLAAAGLPDVRSIAAVPVLAGEEYWGVIGFHQWGQEREWTAIEMEALRSASLILGEAIHRQRTRDAIKESEERWRLLAENVPDVIATVARDGTILALNRTVSGVPVEQRIGKSAYQYIAPEDRETMRACLQRVCQTQKPEAYQVLGIGAGGEKDAWYETRVLPIRRDEEVIAVTLISRDITERKRAAEALAESEARYRQLFENSVLGIYRTTPDGRILAANPALCRMLGYSCLEELLQRNLEQEGFEPDYERSIFKERIEKDGEVAGLESAWARRDGTTLFVRENARVVRDDEGRALYYEGTVEDITDRKRAEEELRRHREHLEELVEERTAELTQANEDLRREVASRKQAEQELLESEESLKALLNAIPEAAFLMDARGVVLQANEGVARRLGLPMDQLLGSCVYDALPADLARSRKEWVGRVVRTGRPQRFADQRAGRYVDNTISPVLGPEGRVERVAILGVDITEQKQSEEALRESEEKYRRLFATVSDAITMFDPETRRFVDINDAAVRLYGYTRKEFLQLKHADIIADPRRSAATIKAALADTSSRSLVRYHRKKDGTVFPVEISASKFVLRGRTVLFGVIRDITQRKKAEDALRDSQRFIQRIANATPNLLYVYDLVKQQTVFVNEPISTMLGYAPEELREMGSKLIAVLVHPDDQEAAAEHARTLVTARTDDVLEWEFRIKYADGGWHWLHSRSVVFARDEQGTPTQLLGTAEDVTDRRRSEQALRESEEKYRRLFATVSDAIVVFDAETKQFVDVNEAAVHLYGYSREEFLKLRQPQVTAEPRKSAASIRRTLAGYTERIPVRYHRKKDGTVFPVEISAGHFVVGGSRALCGVIRDITERRRGQEALRGARRKLMTAREEEQKRLARELHDSVSQKIIAMHLRLRNLCDALAPAEDQYLAAALEELTEHGAELIREVRQISHGLYPPTLEQLGLRSVLDQLAADCKARNVQAATRCDPAVEDARFTEEVEIGVFRIAQEAISNVLRHAYATQVQLVLGYEDGRLVLQVTDDGVGFDPSSALRGLGLNSMQDRARALDGDLKISSRPGCTSVTVRVPAQPLPQRPRDAGSS